MSGPITIDLWIWSLDAGQAERERLARWLSADEAARAARFHFERDQRQHVVAHGRLREILAARTSAAPDRLRFAVSKHGKPTLAEPHGPPPHFNLSHAGGLAALAVSDDAELGLDIEAIRPLKEDVAGRFFSAREVAAYRALPEPDRLPGFYRCWTRKEAVLKSLGDGLSRRLDSFDVTLRAEEPPRIERIDGEPDAPRDWSLLHFDPAPGFVGAIALRSQGRAVVLRLTSSSCDPCTAP
jgi:4'-phosphopantetheinyl transferase